jgi:DNA repair protein RadC
MKNKPPLLARLAVEPALLSDSELLACALHHNPGPAELKAAEKLIGLSGSIGSMALADPGARYSTRLRAVRELGKRLATRKAGIFLKPRDIWEELRDIRVMKKEYFVVFYLDTRNQEIKRDIVSIGTLNYNLVHPREVFEPAVRNLAASVIVSHNHPSGCLEPSDEDLSLTKRLTQAGKILGIELLDHVIVTSGGFMSFKEKNLI